MPGVTVAGQRTRPSRPPLSSVSASSNLAGCIKWLPSPSDNDAHLDLPKSCHDHPIIILSSEAGADGTVDIFIVTSLGSRTLQEAHPDRLSIREQYLPIHPSKKHPDNSILLRLASHCRELDKASFVNTGNRWTIPFKSLRRYNGRDGNYRLSTESYWIMITHCDYLPADTARWSHYLQGLQINDRRQRSSRATEERQLATNARQSVQQQSLPSSSIPQNYFSTNTTTRASASDRNTHRTVRTWHSNFRATISEPPARGNYGTIVPRHDGSTNVRPVRWSNNSASPRGGHPRHAMPSPPGSGDWKGRLFVAIVVIICWFYLFYGVYRAGVAVVDLAKTAWDWVRETWNGLKMSIDFVTMG